MGFGLMTYDGIALSNTHRTYLRGELIGLQINAICKLCKKKNEDVTARVIPILNEMYNPRLLKDKTQQRWHLKFKCYDCKNKNDIYMDSRMFELTYGEYI